MANPSPRSKQLSEFGLTESLLKGLFTSKHPAEGVWLAEHELKHHIEWAQRRHEFLLTEIAKAWPDEVVPGRRRGRKMPTEEYDGPPIVSHVGRGGPRTEPLYGETLG